PFLNVTIVRLMSWFHSGSNLKSNGELNSLVHGVMLHKEFAQEHLKGFSAEHENKCLDDTVNALPGEPLDGWSVRSVKLKLPAPKVSVPEVDAPEFEVSGILYCPLLDVLVKAFQSPDFHQYQTTPFDLRWDP
ncbi:hypothetical protein B0H14DRAFT_3568185, partial [Mycena olivaceomarginata]